MAHRGSGKPSWALRYAVAKPATSRSRKSCDSAASDRNGKSHASTNQAALGCAASAERIPTMGPSPTTESTIIGRCARVGSAVLLERDETKNGGKWRVAHPETRNHQVVAPDTSA